MFAHVKTFRLFCGRDPQAYGLIDQFENDKGGHEGPDKAGNNA